METHIDKEQLINAIRETDDERILFAISRLLQIDDEVPTWHKDILDERTDKLQNGEEKFYDWNNVKDDLQKFD